jgi:hypothetical protein
VSWAEEERPWAGGLGCAGGKERNQRERAQGEKKGDGVFWFLFLFLFLFKTFLNQILFRF